MGHLRQNGITQLYNNTIALDIRVEILVYYALSTLFQSYPDDGRVKMEGTEQ